VLSFDKNLAEGIGVTAAPYMVRNGEARIEPDPGLQLVNPDLEDYKENRLRGYQLQEQPGSVSFVDTTTAHHGKASLRVENFTANPYGHRRLMQEIAVHPHRLYRFTCWLKTEALAPANRFVIQVLDRGGRSLAPVSFDVPVTAGWQKLQIGFNSLDAPLVRIYAGIWGGRSGNFWLDDWSVEEIDLTNVRRRDGTPVTVRDAAAGPAYEEGRDYARIQDPSLNFRSDHEGPPIRALPAAASAMARVCWSTTTTG